MVTYFNEKDVTSFGYYILSKGRRKAFEATQNPALTNLEDRIGQVFASDFLNWKEFVESKKFHADECAIKHSVHPWDIKCDCHRKDGKRDLTK